MWFGSVGIGTNFWRGEKNENEREDDFGFDLRCHFQCQPLSGDKEITECMRFFFGINRILKIEIAWERSGIFLRIFLKNARPNKLFFKWLLALVPNPNGYAFESFFYGTYY